jgi:hypothetical protein
VHWHKWPPQTPEDCRFRGRAEHDDAGEFATCGLVRAALPESDDRFCRAPRSTCLACCQAAPATPLTWNPVVGSLVYHAASTLLNKPDARPEATARAAAARAKALASLDAVRPGSALNQRPVGHFDQVRELIPPPAVRRPEPVRKWAVGVTTAPRPHPTLDACLESLARAGWEFPHLFMDSAVRISGRFGHLPGTLRSPAAGAWPNHYLALLELTMRQPDVDAYLIMQDDALIYDSENVRAYLEQVLWPGSELPIVSLYCAEPYTATRFGWHRYRKSWVWGALALIFPRATVQAYLCDRSICRHRWRSRTGGLSQIDVLIGWWARRRRIPFWFPTPSLVQHIGETSTLSADCPATGPRAAGLFVGNKSAATPSAEVASHVERRNVLG